MKDELILTDAEKEAKNFFLNLFGKGRKVPVDDCSIQELIFDKPKWMDIEKCKRGQEFFQKNKVGILASNKYSLLCFLNEPKGLEILIETDKSSTIETAKKRYVSTIMHTLAWYDYKFEDNSEALKSLLTVRKMHLSASKMAQSKGWSFITQTQVVVTAFGFMGIPLVRSHIFGINTDCRDDVEAFVHLWAVISYMLGVNDEFNMCLFKLETVEIICQLILRYMIHPILQFETDNCKKMGNVLISGLCKVSPLFRYGSEIFLTKRAFGIPGYQFNVDLEKEKIIRNIFDEDDIKKYNEIIENDYLNPLAMIDLKSYYEVELSNSVDVITDVNENTQLDSKLEIKKYNYLKYFNLDKQKFNINIKEFSVDKWKSYLNDSKYYELTYADRFYVYTGSLILNINKTSFGYWFNTKCVNYFIKKLEESHKSSIK